MSRPVQGGVHLTISCYRIATCSVVSALLWRTRGLLERGDRTPPAASIS